jgi:hypothetical protein
LNKISEYERCVVYTFKVSTNIEEMIRRKRVTVYSKHYSSNLLCLADTCEEQVKRKRVTI